MDMHVYVHARTHIVRTVVIAIIAIVTLTILAVVAVVAVPLFNHAPNDNSVMSSDTTRTSAIVNRYVRPINGVKE
jgi:hypothetical protein